MLIDRDHRAWGAFTTATAAGTGVLYGLYVAATPYGASGGSWPGLAFGIAGTLLMLVAVLLAWRKRRRTARLGSAQLWMKMHIWFGALAVPMILFHSGFSFGGPLTTALMVLFVLVTVSGIFGLLVQQVVPRMMTVQVPAETIHSQFEQVCNTLAADAYELVASAVGEISEADAERAWLSRIPAARWKATARQRAANVPAAGSATLKAVYLSEVLPYLRAPRGRAATAPDLRPLLIEAVAELHPKIDKLRTICEERRQLDVQLRLHAWLHNWLFVHAPLSFALLVVTAFHIVFALRY